MKTEEIKKPIWRRIWLVVVVIFAVVTYPFITLYDLIKQLLLFIKTLYLHVKSLW